MTKPIDASQIEWSQHVIERTDTVVTEGHYTNPVSGERSLVSVYTNTFDSYLRNTHDVAIARDKIKSILQRRAAGLNLVRLPNIKP